MLSRDIVVGQEYQVTAQANPLGGGYSSRFESGRVKVLSVSDGRFECEYLHNPYSWSIRNRPRPGTPITLSARSLLRPWADQVAEKEEELSLQEEHDRTVEEADRVASELQTLMPELEIESCEAIRLDHYPDGSPRPVLELRLPLDVLAALQDKLQEHPGLTPKPTARPSSLAELV